MEAILNFFTGTLNTVDWIKDASLLNNQRGGFC